MSNPNLLAENERWDTVLTVLVAIVPGVLAGLSWDGMITAAQQARVEAALARLVLDKGARHDAAQQARAPSPVPSLATAGGAGFADDRLDQVWP